MVKTGPTRCSLRCHVADSRRAATADRSYFVGLIISHECFRRVRVQRANVASNNVPQTPNQVLSAAAHRAIVPVYTDVAPGST